MSVVLEYIDPDWNPAALRFEFEWVPLATSSVGSPSLCSESIENEAVIPRSSTTSMIGRVFEGRDGWRMCLDYNVVI